MTEDFFDTKEVVVKCSNCPLKGNSCNYSDNTLVYDKGTDVLFVLEFQEDRKILEFFKNRVSRYFEHFSIAVGLNCSPKNKEVKSPIYKTYKYCNTLTEEFVSKYKVVVVVGNALQAITQNSDIDNWIDFNEFLFNQTYLYTRYNWKKKTRVYPIPKIIEWQGQDNFKNFFVNKQFKFIREYLDNYSEFEFEDYENMFVEDTDKFFVEHDDKKILAWDTETNNLNCFVDDFKCGCMTISFDGKKGYYLPFDKIDKRQLNSFLSDKESIGANIKYDVKTLNRFGINRINMSEDVITLYHLLNTNRRSNSLKSLAWLIGFGGYDTELDEYLSNYRVDNYLQIPESILFKYATIDAIVTYRLYEHAKKKLVPKQSSVYKVYKEYVMPVIPVFLEMENNGMIIDKNYLQEFHDDLSKQIKEIEIEIKKELNQEFEVSSNEQLGKALEKYGLPDLGRTKKGHYKTGDEILQQWIISGFSVVEKISRYRALSKLDESFVGNAEEKNGMWQHIMSDEKAHPNYGVAMTKSYRSVCSSPNFQQMPKHGDLAKKFRKIFKCPEDYYIGEADFSGFQLRIACIYSQDKVMEDVFLNRGGDLHSSSAQSIFCRDISLDEFLKVKNIEPYKTLRHKAKNQINFPLLFSSSPYVIYGTIQTEWTEEERQNYIKENDLVMMFDRNENPDSVLTVIVDLHKKFFETYPELKEWIDENPSIASKQGYMDSWHGGRRHLPEMKYRGENFDKGEWTNLSNISTNSPVQCMEAIEAYRALISVFQEMKKLNLKSKIIGMVHDSQLYYIHKSEVEIMYNLIMLSMENRTSFNIPITGDLNLSKVWGFGEEVTKENVKSFSM